MNKRSKVYEKQNKKQRIFTQSERNEDLSAVVEHPVFFRAWQRDDKLCAGDLVLYAERVGAHDGAFDGKFLCALCAAQHFCGCSERQMEQEGDHAGVRYAGGGKHGGYADSAEK